MTAPFVNSSRTGVIPVDGAGVVSIRESATRHISFPSLAKLPDGRLICTYANAAFDGSNDADIAICFSSDLGLTWTAERIILSHLTTGYSVGPGGVHVDTNGVIRIAYQQKETPEVVKVLTSRDAGATWTEIVGITTGLTGLCRVSEPIIQLGNGDLILPIYGYVGAGWAYDSTLVRSTDDGLTWGSEVTIAAALPLSWGEPNIVQRDGGDLVCMIRECAGTQYTYQSVSTDNGVTWSAPVIAFPSNGGAPRISKLTSGALLCCFRGKTNSGGNAYRNSWDGGATWQAEAVVESTGVYSDYAQPCEIMGGLVALVYGRRTSSTSGSIRLVYLYDGWDGQTPFGTRHDSASADIPPTGIDSIAAWVTDPAGNLLASIERSSGFPYRALSFRWERRAAGACSLQYAMGASIDGSVFARGNLIWMSYRGQTRVFVSRGRQKELTKDEHGSDWVTVQGRGIRSILRRRLVYPTAFDPSTANGRDPTKWGTDAQWYRVVGRAAGSMVMDMITASASRFAAEIPIDAGTIGTSGADGWTQDFCFETIDDVMTAVEAAYGDFDLVGDPLTGHLVLNYYPAWGADRSGGIIFEEGADLLAASVDETGGSDTEPASYIVAGSRGEGNARTAPLTVSTQAAAFRVEAYLDARDMTTEAAVQIAGDGALREQAWEDAIAVDATEDRYEAWTHYGPCDLVGVISPSRGIDATGIIVAMTVSEEDEVVRTKLDLNAPRTEDLLKLRDRQKATAQSLGVTNRQPQGQLTAFTFSGADVLDDTDTMDVFLAISDRVYVTIEVSARIRFRQFFASAKSVAAASSGSLTSDSGGGSTSGSSGTLTSASGGASTSGNTGIASGITTPAHTHAGGAAATWTGGADAYFWAPTADGDHTHSTPNHQHTVAGHDHSTPNHQHTVAGHTHALTVTYGVIKETMPASHSVTLKVYELVSSTWTLRSTVAALTDDFETVDLTPWITGPGDWRLELKSDAAQPNGGRLGCDVYGAVIGAIQSS